MLVTFDIWDTLLRRRCHPDEVKLLTCRVMSLRLRGLGAFATPWELFGVRLECEREIGLASSASGLDDEYALRGVLARVLQRVAGAPQNGNGSVRSSPRRIEHLADELAGVEFEQEKYVSYADPLGRSMLRERGGERPVAVTDFYMSAGRMRELLVRHYPGVDFARVYSSCDVGLNKRSGRLFGVVQREHGAHPGAHLHVGNSEWSDVRPCERGGARAVWFKSAGEDRLCRAHEARFEARRAGAADGTVALLEASLRRGCSPPGGFSGPERELYEAGFMFSPVYAGLVLRACEEAVSRGCPRVHYFTREGELFASVHRAMSGAQPLGVAMPEADVLEVSRLATFFPSLREFTPAELMRVWNMYSWQSMSQLLRTMGLNGFSLEPWLGRYGIAPEEVIQHPWKDARVRAFLADRQVTRQLARWRAQRREALLGYLGAHGLSDRAAVVVDIGWRGTIQDNLACLLPNTPITGVYMGLNRLLNQQPPNTEKFALGPDARRSGAGEMDVLRWVAPFEMVSNTGSGSVIGYRRVGPTVGKDAGAVFEGVREDNPGENAVFERFTRHFQRGVLDAAPLVADWIRTFAMSSEEMRPHCLSLMRRLVSTPPRSVADAFFNLTHNETFGVGGYVDKRAEPPRELLARVRGARGERDPEAWRALRDLAEASTWPQGYFVHLGRGDLAARYERESGGGGAGDSPASATLAELERSRAYRWSVRFKDLPVYRVYAKAKWGEGWDRPPVLETPEERLRRVRRGRVYRMLAAAGKSPVARTMLGTGRGR